MHLSEILYPPEERGQYFNAVSPPVIQTSNFTFASLDAFRQAFTNELEHHIYSRGNNPTSGILRQKLAALEERRKPCLRQRYGRHFERRYGNVQAGVRCLS